MEDAYEMLFILEGSLPIVGQKRKTTDEYER
jgi:hypothetical protein